MPHEFRVFFIYVFFTFTFKLSHWSRRFYRQRPFGLLIVVVTGVVSFPPRYVRSFSWHVEGANSTRVRKGRMG